MVSQYRLHAVVKSVKVSLYGCLGRASLVGAWRRGGEPFSTDVVLVLAGVVHKVAYFSLFLIFFLFPFTHCWLFSLSPGRRGRQEGHGEDRGRGSIWKLGANV